MQLRVQDDSGRFTILPDAPVPFTVKNGPHQAPIGGVTSPQPNAVLTGIVTVSGFAYSPGGQVTSVALLIDGAARASQALRVVATYCGYDDEALSSPAASRLITVLARAARS